ncbi:hypothetical protein GCWU000324_01459 [Kingella oralis ATCC 51147]|uniref:Uncharacterized protein n=1 Tax=Kingella oralis ATCC 51147 TaxID=629741 RepID=C4GKF6_9NEIS|nr:hypothetical protein GCWU000324_01459 [Kingella oralis ATCC 51147]
MVSRFSYAETRFQAALSCCAALPKGSLKRDKCKGAHFNTAPPRQHAQHSCPHLYPHLAHPLAKPDAA